MAAFTATTDSIPLVTICMGPEGELSRILFPALGSLFTFAHAGKPSAPGQLNCDETQQLLARFYPAYKSSREKRI